MNEKFLVVSAAMALVSCNQSTDKQTSNAAAATKADKPKHSAYCFFKDEEAKGWKASLDKSGNVTVTGKLHVKDARYKAELGQPEGTSTSVELWPTLVVNNTGYAAADNWWDVSLTVPNSVAVTNVAVRCGRKTMAELTVKRAT